MKSKKQTKRADSIRTQGTVLQRRIIRQEKVERWTYGFEIMPPPRLEKSEQILPALEQIKEWSYVAWFFAEQRKVDTESLLVRLVGDITKACSMILEALRDGSVGPAMREVDERDREMLLRVLVRVLEKKDVVGELGDDQIALLLREGACDRQVAA